MGKLIITKGAEEEWGDVVKSTWDANYPCFDGKYREITWTFIIDKEFFENKPDESGPLQYVFDFENEDILDLFEDRGDYTVEYNNTKVEGMTLQSYKRIEILTPLFPPLVSYEVVFTKEEDSVI